MPEFMVGEIRMFAGNYAPGGWALCDGQQLSVHDNAALFAVVGNLYGGDGKDTFALPDMRGRIPVHRGAGYSLGDAGGDELADVGAMHVPGHSHTSPASAMSHSTSAGATVTVVADPRPIAALHGPGAELASGANHAHDNMQPYMALHFIIALESGESSDDPFVGEVRIFAGKSAPAGWKRCDGQSVSVEDNAELYAVLGTTYGGDGRSSFNLPDLRTRAALHAGLGDGLTLRKLGEQGGSDVVALTESQLPFHSHQILSTEPGSASGSPLVAAVEAGSSRGGSALSGSGAGEPHNNMQPYLALNYCVAVHGRQSG